MRLISMARKRAAVGSVAAIVAGTAAATLGVTATPAFADASTTLSCTASGIPQAFTVPVTVTGKISGADHHPGDTVTLDGVSATATIQDDLAAALTALLPDATNVTVGGTYHVAVTGESDDPAGPSDGEVLDIPMTEVAVAPGASLGSQTVSTSKHYDVGPAPATFSFFVDGFNASLDLKGKGTDESGAPTDVTASLDVSCSPTEQADVVIDQVDVTPKPTPPGNGGTGPGGNGGNNGTDKPGNGGNTGNNSGNHSNTGNNSNANNSNTGNNTNNNSGNTQGRGTLANTGASNVVPMTATGGALVLLGGGLLFFMRRRRAGSVAAVADES